MSSTHRCLCVCLRRRVTSAAGRARAVAPARRDRLPQPALAVAAHSTAHVCASGGASRAWRDEPALCRPRDATALPSRCWRRTRAVRPVCVPAAARRERGGTSTRATRQPSPAGAGGGRAPCGPCVCRWRCVANDNCSLIPPTQP
jgi:hypothetical protein